MKLLEFKKKIATNPEQYTLPMFFIEKQPISVGQRKLIYNQFYNGNHIINPFYKKIHRLL